MYLSNIVSYNSLIKLKLLPSILPVSTQLRFKKQLKRKPRWLAMAPCKVFRIPKHPELPMDEKELFEDLLDEYYRKQDSLRKLFLEEIQQKEAKKEDISLVIQREEENFKLLLEENKRENERIRIIREEAIDGEFQEKLLDWLEKAEEKKQEMEKRKLIVEEIIRKEKVKHGSYITLENIDQAIENAIDNPVNINFSVSVDGKIKWEGKPPLDYEADITSRVTKSKEM